MEFSLQPTAYSHIYPGYIPIDNFKILQVLTKMR